jgi:hypothetical protein
MVDGALEFQFETCLLKHHVRVDGWLPSCRRRLKAVQAEKPRRLRYFTFCAVGAVDVLMLDVAKVIRPSDNGKFDTVVFFDKDSDAVNETLKRIAGSIGFNGSFTDIVLLDPHEVVGEPAPDALGSNVQSPDDIETRQVQRDRQQHLDFIPQFPFDIINLDLEEFLFKDQDPTPGKVIRAIRKLFEWQRRPLHQKRHPEERLSAFSFMFTTQVGPEQLADDHRAALVNALNANLAQFADLPGMLEQRCGTQEPQKLLEQDFERFFKLAVPKAIASIAWDEDWYVDPDHGVKIYEFQRPAARGDYKMLHLVMDFVSPSPGRERRVGPVPVDAQNAYANAVRKIFADDVIPVTPETINEPPLKKSLNHIFARRRKYYPEDRKVEL